MINIEEKLTFREYWNLTPFYNGVPYRWRFIPSGQQRQNYTATIYALIRRLHRQIIPAAKVDNQDPLKKPSGSAAVESNSQTLCMTKGSSPEAKLDYQIDFQPSPLTRQLNLLPKYGRDKRFTVSGRTTTPNSMQLARDLAVHLITALPIGELTELASEPVRGMSRGAPAQFFSFFGISFLFSFITLIFWRPDHET